MMGGKEGRNSRLAKSLWVWSYGQRWEGGAGWPCTLSSWGRERWLHFYSGPGEGKQAGRQFCSRLRHTVMSSSSGNPEGARLPTQGLLVLPKGAFPVRTSSGSRTELHSVLSQGNGPLWKHITTTVAQRLVILLSLTILSHWILETVKGVREIAKRANCFVGKCKGLSSDLRKLCKAGMVYKSGSSTPSVKWWVETAMSGSSRPS